EPIVGQAEALGGQHRLGEGVDLLVADLLVDGGGEQARRQARVLRLLGDEAGRGLDRELIELAGGRAVVEAADGLGRHPQGVDVPEPQAAAVDRADDLVDVHRLRRAVPLAHPHRGLGIGLLPVPARRRPVALRRFCQHRSLPSRPLGRQGRRAKGRENRKAETRKRALLWPDLPASREASRSNRRRMSPGAGCWQVFGLASRPVSPPGSYCPPLPSPEAPVLVVEVVLAYRCGAAPDFHRVPFSPGERPRAPAQEATYCTVLSSSTIYCVPWAGWTPDMVCQQGNPNAGRRLVPGAAPGVRAAGTDRRAAAR